MEEQLHGHSGYTLFIRDKDNNTKSVIAEGRQEWKHRQFNSGSKAPGDSPQVLKDHVGTIVALDGKTGEFWLW